MKTDGHKGSANPGALLATLFSKREKLQEELRSVEKQVYELETSYLQESSHFRNALKGYEGFLSSSKSASNLKRSRKFQPEDRIFSLSSVTSPAEEQEIGRDDGRSHLGIGRSKCGTVPANGQVKPKKGRMRGAVTRDAKRTKQSNEVDFDDEDDLDMSSR